jgi:hypothetical protein
MTERSFHDISSQIGALEIGPMAMLNDGTLEDVAGYALAGPTIAPCTVMTCPRVDDGALEAAAGNVSLEPSGFNQPCPTFHSRCIDDGALEASAASTAGPSADVRLCTKQMCTLRTDDSVN